MKHTIKTFAYILDHGDGGGSTTVYPSLEALQEDRDFSDEKMEEILAEDDTYENGEISEDIIEIDIDDEGTAHLAKKMRFSWGQ